MAGGDVSGEFIVTTADVPHERVPGGGDRCGPVTLQSAYGPQPRFQAAMVGFDRVVRVALDGMQC